MADDSYCDDDPQGNLGAAVGIVHCFLIAVKLALSSSQEVGRMRLRAYATSFATLAIAEDAFLLILPATSE